LKKPNICNEAPAVANIVDPTINKAVKEATQRVFESVIRLDRLGQIAEDITALLTAELKNASFMTVQLELTEAQREKLMEFVSRATTTAKDRYVGNLKTDQRTKDTVELVEGAMKSVVEEALSAIGQEINRGAIISSTAVSANAKKEDFNSIELNYSKAAGDITIPTKGIFISTNCVQVIQDSCKVDVVNPETGEIIEGQGLDGSAR
jgi:predicted CopG family antitoxin